MRYFVVILGAFFFGVLLSMSFNVNTTLDKILIILGGILILQIVFESLKSIKNEKSQKE